MDLRLMETLGPLFIFLIYYFPALCHTLECVQLDNCLCLEYDNIEIQCPKDDVEVSIRVTPKNHVEIQCLQQNTPFFDVGLLPELNLGDVDFLKLEFCYLNTTFNKILDKFNISNITHLSFETLAVDNGDRIIDVTKDMFESMQSLKSLTIDYSTLKLHKDFLANTPNLHILSLNKNGLKEIDMYFKYTPNLELLDLSRNQIGSLPNGVFADLRNLTRLYLWNNNLTALTKNMFTGLSNLKLIELSFNHIEELAEDAFMELNGLVNISLRNNNINKCYSNTFKNCSLLENIRLDFNPGLILMDNVFANLTSLKTVELSNNNLDNIPENTFRNCTSLETLILKTNRLATIPGKLLTGLTRIKKLDLSENMIASILAEMFESLISLEELNLSNNKLTNIENNVFQKAIKLKTLILNKNRISVVGLKAFTGLKDSLRQLDMSYNMWKDVTDPNLDATPLNECLQIEDLNLSHNLIDQYPYIPALLKIRKMDLSFNHIHELVVSDFAYSTQNTIKIDLSNNEIRTVDFQVAEIVAKSNINSNHDASHYNGEASTIIILNNNPILCDCVNFDLIRYNNDEMKEIKTLVELKQDKLTCAYDNNTLVQDLKPHQIDCPVLMGCPSECSCSYMPFNTAVVLDCSSRNLTEYPEFNFTGTKHQQTRVNLSFNELRLGPPRDLKYENITYLDLSGNGISDIDWIPPKIKELNLNHNNFKRLSTNFITMLKNSTSLEKLHLKENLWKCDCDAYELQKFLMQYYHKVNSSDVTCHDKHVQLVKITDLCKMSIYLTVLLPILLTVLLFFAISFALYYRYQTEIKIYLYAKNLCLWFVTEEELDKDKKYDVFISYSHQDEKFVVDQLLPELERGETPFEVCVHIRDWVPGEFIAKQVVTSVKNSRRTLVVLSNSFVDSEWGKLEFRTAHTEALSEGRARVIIVVYGDLDESKLDNELNNYLKSNTYVKWGDKYFWNKLKYALPHSKTKHLERNKKQTKMMLKIDDKFDLVKNPPSPTNTSTPPIALDPSLLKDQEMRIDIPNKGEGEDPLLIRRS